MALDTGETVRVAVAVERTTCVTSRRTRKPRGIVEIRFLSVVD
jgi:hypothetical protein